MTKVDLVKLAEIADKIECGGNGDGKLLNTEREVSVFEGLAKDPNYGGYDDATIDTFKSSVKAGATSPIAADAERAATSSNFRTQNESEAYVLKMMKEKSDSPLAEVTGAVTRQLEIGRGVADTDKVVLNEIAKMVAVAGTFNSKDDVDKIHDKLKNYMKENDIKDDFHKDVAKQIEKMAEAEQRRKEYAEVKKAFKEAYKECNLETAYDKVKEQFKKKGSYYKDVLKSFEEKDVMEEARKLSKSAIRESEAETKRAVKKDAKENLGSDYDKYTKKALGGETPFLSSAYLKAEDSDMKIEREKRATKNVTKKAAEKAYTKEEIDKYLGKDGTLRASMVDKGLIKQNEDGTYDISVLSEALDKYLGGNSKLDKNIKEMDAISEETKTTSGLATESLSGLMSLNDKQMNALRKLCKYPDSGINFTKAFYKAGVGAVLGAAAGAFSAGTNRSQSYATERRIGFQPDHIHTETQLNFTFGDNIAENVDVEALNSFSKNTNGIDITTTVVNGVNIITDVTIERPDLIVPFVHKVSKMIVPTALKTGIIGAAIGFLDGMKRGPEIPITSTAFDCTDLETYIARLKNEVANKKVPEKYASAIIAAASLPDFQKADGSWDCDKFKAWLLRAAGNDTLNREELIGALQDLEKKPPVTPPAEEPKSEAYIADETETKIETKEVEKFWGARKHQNKDLVKMYPCLVEDFGETKAIAMMKVIQGIKNGNYDVDFISGIADDHFKMLNKQMTRADFIAKYKDAKDFDVNTYLSVRGAELIGDEAEVEREVNGRKEKVVDTFILAPAELTRNGQTYCEKDVSLVTRTIDRNAKGGGNKYGTLNGSYSTESQSSTYWGGKKGDQSATKFKSKKDRNSWVSGLPAGTPVIQVGSKTELERRINK